MNSERIKELCEQTAYPESRSVARALHQVWNECAHEDKDLRQQVATLQKEALKVYQLDGSCVEMGTAEQVIEFRKGCAKLLQTQAQEIDTLQKDNDTLNTDLKEAEGAVADLMELNDRLTAEVVKKKKVALWLFRNMVDNRERAEKAEAERDQLKKDSVSGWRSCIDHIIKPESPCPVCEVARLREALEEIATTGERTSERAPRFVAIEALNHKEK